MVYDDKMHHIIDTLEDGGVLLYPTDTIWGLGCHIQKPEAVERIYAIKNRPRNKPLLLLVDSLEMLLQYVDIHPRIETLLLHHVRPLTIIYPKTKNIPQSLLAEDQSIAIRIVQDPYVQQIIRLLGSPITSTSANLSGRPFPKAFADIPTAITDAVDYACLHRRDEVVDEPPSVMVSYNEKGDINIIRA